MVAKAAQAAEEIPRNNTAGGVQVGVKSGVTWRKAVKKAAVASLCGQGTHQTIDTRSL